MSGDIETLRALLAAADPTVAGRLRDATAARRSERGGHEDWARLCEEAGELGLAFTEYQLAVRDSPDDPELLARLAVLYDERGDSGLAIRSATELWQVRPDEASLEILFGLLTSNAAFEQAGRALEEAAAQGVPDQALVPLRARLQAERRAEAPCADDEPIPGPLPFTDADVVRFTHLFSGRENIYARQWANEQGDVGYSPVREPFTVREARNHLLGSITAGIYLVRLDNTVNLFAIDIDITKRAISSARGNIAESRRLRALAASEAVRVSGVLADLGLPSLMEDSGYKGRHVWVFLSEPEAASVVRQLGALVLAHAPIVARELHAEFFPKQASAGAGVGNLIKLPLGIHRRTGRRSRILRPDGLAEPDAFGALRRQPRIDRTTLHAGIARLKALPLPVSVVSRPGADREDEARAELPPVPAPPVPTPAWTAADFDTNPEVSRLFSHCAVLAALREKAERHRRLTHDERLVLIHAAGHSGTGVLAVNYLFELCVDTPRTALLQSPLAGNPISCPKIRKRIPHITGAVACHCAFEWAADRYPTPRLHLLGGELPAPARVAKDPQPPWDPVDRVRTLGVLWVRRAKIEREIASIQQELYTWMEAQGITELDTGDGVLLLVQEAGAPPALEWQPREKSLAATEATTAPSRQHGQAVPGLEGPGVTPQGSGTGEAGR